MKHEKIALKLIGAIVSISATREDQKVKVIIFATIINT